MLILLHCLKIIHAFVTDLSNSWDFAERYEKAFKPLYVMTKDMQAEHVSLSDFYLQWIIATQKVKQTEPNPFASELVASMGKRLQNLQKSRAFKMAIYLDPWLNYAGSKLFCNEEKEEIQVRIFFSFDSTSQVVLLLIYPFLSIPLLPTNSHLYKQHHLP